MKTNYELELFKNLILLWLEISIKKVNQAKSHKPLNVLVNCKFFQNVTQNQQPRVKLN